MSVEPWDSKGWGTPILPPAGSQQAVDDQGNPLVWEQLGDEDEDG